MLKSGKSGMSKSGKIGFGLAYCGMLVLLLIGVYLSRVYHGGGTDQNVAGIRDYEAGRYAIAIPELRTYLKAHPPTPLGGFKLRTATDDAQLYLGEALRKQHRYAEAEDAFRVYSRCSAEEAGDYRLGETLLEDNKPVEARVAFQRVIDTDETQGNHGHSWHLVELSKAEIAKINQTH